MIQVTSETLNDSSDYQWHIERRKHILQKYPEIKNYFGNYPPSLIFIAVLVVLQWSIAWFVRDQPWWTIGLISLFIGQFVLHSLATFTHEAAHNLILRGRVGSVLSLLAIELGMPSFGKSLEYISVHTPSHHLYLNEYEKDYEWWDKKKAEFLSKHLPWRVVEALFHLLPGGPIVTELILDSSISPDRCREIRGSNRPAAVTVLFVTTSLVIYALAWYCIGPKASLYLFWSLSLMIGNWGVTFKGQSICEHHIHGKGKTYSSYYRWSNFLFFNTGYHDEHHTFPNVPWVHLPKIKQIAPEYFTNDAVHSYVGWWWLWAKSCFHPTGFNRYS